MSAPEDDTIDAAFRRLHVASEPLKRELGGLLDAVAHMLQMPALARLADRAHQRIVNRARVR